VEQLVILPLDIGLGGLLAIAYRAGGTWLRWLARLATSQAERYVTLWTLAPDVMAEVVDIRGEVVLREMSVSLTTSSS
jgi:hypothetical protein